MNVRLILKLSLLGLLVGALGIVGLLPARWGETTLTGVITIVFAAVLVRNAPGKFFLHGFLTGFIASAASTLLQAAFMDQYLAHNTHASESFRTVLPPNVPPAVVVVIATPFTAAVAGVVTGFITWAWARLAHRTPVAHPTA